MRCWELKFEFRSDSNANKNKNQQKNKKLKNNFCWTIFDNKKQKNRKIEKQNKKTNQNKKKTQEDEKIRRIPSKAELDTYKHNAECFYQLMVLLYGSTELTPDMLIYIDVAVELIETFDFNLIRGSTEGSESLHNYFNCLYYMYFLTKQKQ